MLVSRHSISFVVAQLNSRSSFFSLRFWYPQYMEVDNSRVICLARDYIPCLRTSYKSWPEAGWETVYACSFPIQNECCAARGQPVRHRGPRQRTSHADAHHTSYNKFPYIFRFPINTTNVVLRPSGSCLMWSLINMHLCVLKISAN